MTVITRDIHRTYEDIISLDQHNVITAKQKYLDATAQSGMCPLGLNTNILEQSMHLLKDIPTLQYKNFDYELIRKADEILLEDSHFTHTYWTLGASLACEAAVKIGFRTTGKKGLIGMPHGNNGATFAGNSINYATDRNLFYGDVSAIRNYYYKSLLESIERFHSKCFGVVIEPLLYQEGLVSPGDLNEIHQACKKHNLLLILDETFTGYYRTGFKWYHQKYNLEPDMIFTGKGINNGAVSVGCVLLTQKVFDQLQEVTKGRFEFWQTASGSPGPCATTLIALPQLKNLCGKHLFSCETIEGLTEEDALAQGFIVKIKNNKMVCSPPFTWTKEEYAKLSTLTTRVIFYA
jgi:adenosylmethionine-8-amino-7-oxononanoate aminotransferase